MTSPAPFSPSRLAFDLLSLLLLPLVAATGCEPETGPGPGATTATAGNVAPTAPRAAETVETVETATAAKLMGGPTAKAAKTVKAVKLAGSTVTGAGIPTADDAVLRATGDGASAEPAGPKLTAMAVGTGVEQRALVGEALRFEMEPARVYCFSDLSNTALPSSVTHVWRHGPREIARHALQVGKAKRFRTWSYQRMGSRRQGDWSCEVLGPEGESLGVQEFEFINPQPPIDAS